MAKAILNKFDRLFNLTAIILLMGSGTMIHLLTALTLKSYYGDPWGYVAFSLPILSEAYLLIIQLSDEMYNFTIIISAFLILSLLTITSWTIKNFIRQKLESTVDIAK